jgi:hypothetical protein
MKRHWTNCRKPLLEASKNEKLVTGFLRQCEILEKAGCRVHVQFTKPPREECPRCGVWTRLGDQHHCRKNVLDTLDS